MNPLIKKLKKAKISVGFWMWKTRNGHLPTLGFKIKIPWPRKRSK